MLPSLLSSTMRDHYNRLSVDVCTDFKRVKQSLLSACQITSKHDMDKFCSARKIGKQSYAKFLDASRTIFMVIISNHEK